MTKKDNTIYKIVEAFYVDVQSAKIFADEYIRGLDQKRIEALIAYLNDKSFSNSCTGNDILSAIPTDDEFLQEFYPHLLYGFDEELLKLHNYDEIVSREIFDIRTKELEVLKSILPEYLNEKPAIIEKKEGKLIKGLYYKPQNFNKIRDFHKSLVKSEFIDCDYNDFRLFFKKTFTPTEKKITWLKNPAYLYYLLVILIRNDNNFEIPYKYRYIIEYVFDIIDSDGNKEILTGERLTQNNNYKDKDVRLIDKAFEHLK